MLEKSPEMIVYTDAMVMNTMMNGVIAPITVVTLSTSSMPAASTSTTMMNAPTPSGRPHC